MKIVIAEDDPIALELLRESLRHDGHEVQPAENGEDALSLLENGNARVLISDWEMPGMTGPELCRRVRSRELSRYVFIMLLTGRNNREDLVEGLRAGADDFLRKPFDPLELSVRLGVAERITSLETRDLMIFGMAKLAASRDRETGSHLERVRMYCKVLAEHLSGVEEFKPVVDREFIGLIFATSPLHDIGKVGIPDAIRGKTDRLTPAEFEIMKSHATLGAETLGAALQEFPGAKFLSMAREIALCHHERWDGSGYPAGLLGPAIPLSARIVALADVYDALRSARAYKDPQRHEQARQTILAGSGTHFDPDVVFAFLAAETRFERVARQLADVAGPGAGRLAA